MPLLLAYVMAAGLGLVIAHFISRPPELRSMRLSQFIFVPVCAVVGVSCLQGSLGPSAPVEIGNFIIFVLDMGFLIVLLLPNIGYFCGAAVTNFLDPQNWTPAEEALALQSIRYLIDRDRFHQALSELDVLLKTHKPTYEAVLLKAKLLHQCGRQGESVSALLNLIELCQTTDQQLAVMGYLALLEEYHLDAPKSPGAAVRRIQIGHELVLFQLSEESPAPHKIIPPGIYEVEETFHRHHRWLKLVGENWGNAEMCWEAILAQDQPAAAPPRRGLFWRVARLHQSISLAVRGKPRIQRQAEAQKLFKEAGQWIRVNDWQRALPLLQQASARDPHHYEIAYRCLQAVRQTGSGEAVEQALNQILQQNQWTENEEQMLKQLHRPPAR